ncbi:MAG: DNA-processing protein DprA [Solirubrobacteraceae bacterium]
MTAPRACAACLRRSWLLARLSGHLDVVRSRTRALLELEDRDLIDAVAVAAGAAGEIRGEWGRFDSHAYHAGCATAGVTPVCRCDPAYPRALSSLAAGPAVLHVAGGFGRFRALAEQEPVALVGARAASPYGLECARSLGRGLASAGVTVISGMALGIDSAAHEGALHSGGPTLAVLAAAPERAYPTVRRPLHRRILAAGAVVSELGPGVAVRRWMFPARNRIIAALSRMTVVVAARRGSGAMITAADALSLGRLVGAVPGPVSAPLSWGPHELLRTGARLVAEPADVLVALFGADARRPAAARRRSAAPGLQPLLNAIADGYDPPQAFAQAGIDIAAGLAALAALELEGYIRREPGGRFTIVG